MKLKFIHINLIESLSNSSVRGYIKSNNIYIYPNQLNVDTWNDYSNRMRNTFYMDWHKYGIKSS